MMKSLRMRIFVLFIVLLLIPLLLLSSIVIFIQTRSSIANQKSYLVNSMKKIGSSSQAILNDLDRASLFLIGDASVRNYLSAPKENPDITAGTIYNQLGYLYNNSGMIQAIQLLSVNGEYLNRGDLALSITEAERKRADALNGRAFWGREDGPGGNHYLYMCRLLRDTRDPRRHLGYIKIYLSQRKLDAFYRNERDQQIAYFFVDEAGGLMYSSQPEDAALPVAPELPPETLAAANGNCVDWETPEELFYLTSYRMPVNGWYVVGVSTTKALSAQLRSGILFLLSIAAACLLLCTLLALVLSRRITRPLTLVVNQMKRLEEQDFSVRVPVKGQDELAMLSSRFNHMAQRIQTLIEEVYLGGLHRKEAELRALQNQINPHFLYNTLDMVYWTAKMEKAPLTSDQIESLSRFFRLALADKGDYATVQEEIEHLRYYIILRQQSGPHFEFDLEAEEECLPRRVIKLVLQPLVENAILHGVKDRVGGRVWVHIFRQGENLCMTVEDNGAGVDPDEMSDLMAHGGEGSRGFGIKNINDRIQLAFGKPFGLRFESRPQGGTKTTVVQPFILQSPEVTT